ncbi:MAG: hypothetical protein Q7V01_08995 [Vicinamibacterales bacterium]|nr:hypothetical protein [Vicinamibacterales bacterium]
MRKLGTACILAAFALSLTACGNSKEEEARKAAEEAQKAAVEAQKAATAAVEAGAAAGAAGAAAGAAGAAAGAAEFARGMEQLGQAMQGLSQTTDGQTYTPVSFRELHALLPEISGWEKGKPQGEMMTSPVKFSQSEVTYTKGDARIEVKIVDTAMSALMTMPYRMFMATGYMKETDSGYEKATTFSGNPGWMKWDGDSKHAEAGLIVGSRFLVTVEGNDVDDVKAVETIVSKLDLGKLASLK